MSHDGFAIVSPADDGGSRDDPGTHHVDLTDRLGCTDTRVDGYRTEPGASVELQPRPERVVVPLVGSGTVSAGGPRPVGRLSITSVPAETPATLSSESTTAWLVVSAPVDAPSGTRPTTVDLRTLDFELPTTSDVLTARLTDRLRCRGMKVNVRRLDPGDVVPYHTEGTQEELFVPLDGPGTLRVDGRTHTLERGAVCRVAPALPRSAVNTGDDATRWLMIGAPPSGAADEWDPGAEIVEWPEET